MNLWDIMCTFDSWLANQKLMLWLSSHFLTVFQCIHTSKWWNKKLAQPSGTPCAWNSATLWCFYFLIFYSRVSRLLYDGVKRVCSVFHIPHQRNQTQRWDTLMIWPVFQMVMSLNLSTLPRCKLQKKTSSRKPCGSWDGQMLSNAIKT